MILLNGRSAQEDVLPEYAASKPQLGLKLGLLKDTAGKLTCIVFSLTGVGFALGTCRWGVDRNDPALGAQVGGQVRV